MKIPWGLVVTFGVKVLTFVFEKVIDKNSKTEEAKRSFYEFVDHLDNYMPMRINDEHRRQMAEARRRRLKAEARLKEQDKKIKLQDEQIKSLVQENGKLNGKYHS